MLAIFHEMFALWLFTVHECLFCSSSLFINHFLHVYFNCTPMTCTLSQYIQTPASLWSKLIHIAFILKLWWFTLSYVLNIGTPASISITLTQFNGLVLMPWTSFTCVYRLFLCVLFALRFCHHDLYFSIGFGERDFSVMWEAAISISFYSTYPKVVIREIIALCINGWF